MRLHLAWRAILLLLLACAALPAAAAENEVAQGGVADLRAPGATARLHPLRGDWDFAWQRFVDPATPEAFTARAHVPRSWNALEAPGKAGGPDGHASYGLQVACPPGEQLALLVPAQRTAMRLYINGKLAVAQGVPGATEELSSPAIGRRAALTDPFPCPLRITVHLSNYSHRAGGFVRAPIAGPIEELAPAFKQRLALDTILLGAYLVLGIAPIFYWLARPQDRAPLFFGLFCLVQTLYADMTGERLLLQLAGPETPWETYLRLEYAAWFGSMALYAVLVDRLFPRAMPPRTVRVFLAACLLALAIVATTPARIYSHMVYAGQGLGLALGTFVTFTMARAMRQGRKDAGVVVAGLAFLLLVLATNFLELYADITQRGITAVGLLAFVLSPALVLLRRLARMLSAEEQRSAEEREKVDLLVRATHAGILDWDYTRNLTVYSPRLLEIMGLAPDTDTSGWPLFFERVHPDDRLLVQELFRNQLRDRSVRGGEVKHDPHEYRLLRADGSPVWVHAEAISLRAPDGRTLRYICSFLDITDHRALAEGLKRQNAALAENARLREDVERMSRHDLKTPLNSIIGVARMLREDGNVPPEQRELLAVAERAGYRMLEMVNLSLDLSRMEQGTYEFRPQAVNMPDVVERVRQDLHGLAQSCRVEVRAEGGGAPLYARAEELLCYSILANVAKNAIEATPAGGTVTIRVLRGDPLQVQVHNPGRVPGEIAARFFDKYVTAGKSGGTGLGTYSARLMARVQHGELRMETGDGGTRLTLSLRALGAEPLPAAPERRALAPLAVPVTPADFGPRRVLVVDDDEYNRLLLMRYLPSPPFTVESAVNGLAATEAIARQWPDIVLVDMEMPVMDGPAAVAWIRERERQEGRAPGIVVMMSSNDDRDSIARGLAAGSNRFLVKPFTRESLLALLHALEHGAATQETAAPRSTEPAALSPDATVRVNAELLQEVPAFLDSRRRMVEHMAQALAQGDRAQLRALAHRAAGGLALFGFEWAAWQSRGISARAAQADAGALDADIDRLRKHLQAVQVE